MLPKKPDVRAADKKSAAAGHRQDLGHGTTDPSAPELLERMRGGDRLAATTFLERYGSRIRRRIRGKADRGMRRLFDSEDILATVHRRLDLFVLSGQLRATNQAELWALLLRLTDGAVADKGRISKRVRSAEVADEPLLRLVALTIDDPGSGDADEARRALQRLESLLTDETDRAILSLRLAGNDHRAIGEYVGLTEGAVRARWYRIRRSALRAARASGPR